MALHTNTGLNIFQREQGDPTSTSTTTGTSATATSTGASGNGDNSDQNLSVTGSPPLIVAFLAVGLFLAAMLTIFGWRRMVFGRGFIMQPVGRMGRAGWEFERQPEYFGEEPKLWDLWSHPSADSKGPLNWEQMMPISANIKRSEEIPSNEAGSRATDIHAHYGIPSQLRSIGRHIHRHAKPAGDRNADVRSTESQTLQVAVAIAMPSIHTHEHNSKNEGPSNSPDIQSHEPNDADPLQYSLGLVEMPWHSEG